MAEPGNLSVAFAQDCKTAKDFARRFRVLAAMSDDGVTFRHSPDSLRAMAALFDRIDRIPDVMVIEVDRPVSSIESFYLTFALALLAFGILGDVALAILQWIGVEHG